MFNTMDMGDLPSFFAVMYRGISDDSTWEIWLSKVDDKSYTDFKEEGKKLAEKAHRKNVPDSVKQAEEKEAKEYASQFIQFREEG